MSDPWREVRLSKFLSLMLRIKAGEMQREGVEFFISANGVWLTGHVPAKYLEGESVLERNTVLRAAGRLASSTSTSRSTSTKD